MSEKTYIKTIDTLFEEQAVRTPHHIALQSEQNILSYQSLNTQANKLAHYLISQGVGAEKVVAVHLARSIEAIIAILAILKAGGAYLPLNVHDPDSRITFMLNESRSLLLITHTDNKVPQSICPCPLHTWNELKDKMASQTNTTPKLKPKPHHLAYIMYTSGSTGTPKGVEIEHKGISNMLLSQIDAFEICCRSHVLQFSELTFDASISEIFTALLTGATLHVPSSIVRATPKKLAEYIVKRGISIATLPPTYLALMPSFLHKTFKTLIVAGEPCAKKVMDKYHNKCRLINAYGPTEATVCTTWFQYDGIDNRCIGKAIDHMQCYVLNKRNMLVSPNECGELYISGLGVARGYRNQPKLTQKKFINWYDKHYKRIRLYRTGDRVKLLANGCLRYIGRTDFQIKFNGIRVEPNEIEYALNQHASVLQSTITLKKHKNRAYLIAYIVRRTNKPLSKDLLKDHLKQKIPTAIIPNVFIILDEFPLLSSGKIDRRKLPAPTIEPYITYNDIQLTKTEKLLKKLWIKRLRLKKNIIIGKKCDFFNFGATSIQAAQLITMIKKHTNASLALVDIFNNPTLEKLASKLDQIKEDSYNDTKLKIKSHAGDFPLSFAQKRIWLSHQEIRSKSPTAYNITFALRFHGKLRLRVWKNVLDCLLNRHEILRTYFPKLDVQRVGYFNLEIETYQVSTRAKNYDHAIQGIIDKAASHNFGDLSQLPLFRIAFIRITNDHFVLLMVFHHIIFDESSISILLSDLVTIYNNNIEGKHVVCHPLPIQYTDFSFWQQQKLSAGYYDSAFAYWKNQLQNATPLLNLSLDNARPKKPSYRGQSHTFYMNKLLLKRLMHFAQTKKLSLFTVLCSSITTLLYRYSNQEDFTIGVAYSHRRDEKLNTLIGFFVNMLPIRVQVKDESSFIEVLQHIKLTLLSAYQNNAPIEKIIHHLNLSKGINTSHPLFQVAIVMHDLPDLNLNFKGLKTSFWHPSLIQASNLTTAKFDLSIEMEVLHTGQLAVKIEYATDIFSRSTVENFACYWLTLCNNAIHSPKTPIGKLTLLSVQAQKKLINRWGRLGRCYSKNKNILQSFLDQVKNKPDAIAIVDETGSVTYSELNKKANQLADYILKFKPTLANESVIAIALNSSLNFIISMLAVLKTGSAYLPIAYDSPVDRLKFILTDASTILIITNNQFREKFSSLNVPIISIDDPKLIQSYTASIKTNPKKHIPPSNLAYIIYTSGSTGKPKGVLIEHHNVVQLAKTTLRDITTKDVVGQTCDVTFDASGAEIWGALLNGAKLIIYPKSVLLNVKQIRKRLVRDRTSVLFLTTAIFSQLIALDIHLLQDIKLLHFGGEKFTRFDLLKKIFSETKTNIKALTNSYGPTEATTISATHTIHESDIHRRILPIGQPTPPTLTYILDNYQQALPPDIPGELYLGGLGIARGYLNRPELTKRYFISNPFLKKDEKLYRTGDRVRYLKNGNLIFLGRIDHQVKVSGYRVELGEIERIILEQKKVKEIVVLAKMLHNQRYLIAYLTLRRSMDKKNINRTLQSALLNTLPAYMIPKKFIVLDKLPLTKSGKIDRQALYEIDIKSRIGKIHISPTTKLERLIASCWKRVLGVTNEINVTDNFFELGGNSLLAMELNVLINQSIHDIEYSTLFSHPTIRCQATLLEKPVNVKKQPSVSLEYLKEEATLPPDIKTNNRIPLAHSISLDTILITGATGFLGIFLLESLLSSTQATIYCLVRGKNQLDAYNRLLENIRKYKLENQINLSRVRVVTGNISQPQLGLSKRKYQILSQKVDAVYHAASTVNFMQPYAALRATNVLGTRHILQFSLKNKIKPLHYISSAAVFSFSHYYKTKNTCLLERPVKWDKYLEKSLPNDLGYSQTKAVSEKLLLDASKKRGAPIVIYRVGFILCHSQSGVTNLQQIWSRLVKDCLQLGHYPHLKDVKEEFVTVDYAAQAITHISQQTDCIGKIFHIMPTKSHNITTNDLFHMISRENKPLIPESYDRWLNRLIQFIGEGGKSALIPLLPLFKEKKQKGLTLLELYQESPDFSVRNTHAALKDIHIVNEKIQSVIIKRYIGYLTKNTV
jgi:amino acid adenylation domain-containing protein/thioester reductase-like protein